MLYNKVECHLYSKSKSSIVLSHRLSFKVITSIFNINILLEIPLFIKVYIVEHALIWSWSEMNQSKAAAKWICYNFSEIDWVDLFLISVMHWRMPNQTSNELSVAIRIDTCKRTIDFSVSILFPDIMDSE